MAIDEQTLLKEREVLEKDFNTTKDRITQVEKDLGTSTVSTITSSAGIGTAAGSVTVVT